MFHRATSLAVAILTVAGSLSSQIPRNTGGAASLNRDAPPIMVANPFSFTSGDSSAAVEIGEGLRARLARSVGRDFRVIQRVNMNRYLEQYGYAADAILAPIPAQTLAAAMAARLYLMPTMSRTSEGLYKISARMIGAYRSNNGAGFAVELTQERGQDLDKFGEKVADLFKPAVKAFKETQACIDNQATDPNKAKSAAEKAFRQVPNFGLAEFCLGEIARAVDPVGEVALIHYRNALKTDPQALNAYYAIGAIYQLRDDSENAISTFQAMLTVDPLNEQLREQSFDLFQKYGRMDAAEAVADEGIRSDPNNTDWYDLKSNACLAQSKFDCAVDELERFFEVDETRADTSFFQKISLAARFAEDTTRFVRWATTALDRFPEHQATLEEAARAFAMSGNGDRAIEVTRKLLVLNPDDTEPLVRTAGMLGQAGQAEKAIEFLDFVVNSGDQRLKDSFGNIFVNGASAARSAGDKEKQLLLGQATLDVGATNPQLTSFAGFFIGDVLFPDVTPMRTALVESESCTDLVGYAELIGRALSAFELAATSTNEQIKAFADGVVPFLTTERDETLPQMRTGWECGGN